jgi:DNA-binding transcriptional regulator YiaG
MSKRSALDQKLWPYVSERGEQAPSPDFELVGARFRRGRRQAGLSQRQLATRAGISQSIVSRFERGLVRRSSAEKIVRLGLALGPRFPFGCCPHDHQCPWPANPTGLQNFWEMMKG